MGVFGMHLLQRLAEPAMCVLPSGGWSWWHSCLPPYKEELKVYRVTVMAALVF